MKNFSFVLLTGIFFTIPVFGARPFNTDDGGTVDSGVIEMESGLDIWNGGNDAYISFKTGISGRVDFGVSFGVLPAIGGLETGVKFSAYQNKDLKSAFSVLWEPSSGNFTINLIQEIMFYEDYNIILNFAVSQGINVISGGFMIGRRIGDKIYAGGEINPEYNRRNNRSSYSILFGGNYNLLNNFYLDIGFSFTSGGWLLTEGITYDF